jgi:hypothetical protein
MQDHMVVPLRVWLYTLFILVIIASLFGLLFLIIDDPWALLR